MTVGLAALADHGDVHVDVDVDVVDGEPSSTFTSTSTSTFTSTIGDLEGLTTCWQELAAKRSKATYRGGGS